MSARVAAALPYVALVTAIGFVSSSALLIRLAESPPLVIAAYRMLLASALLALPTLAVQRRDLGLLGARDVGQMAIAGVFLAAHFGLWTASLEHTTVATSVVLVSTHPVFVALAEWLWLGRAVARLGIVGIGATLIGTIIIGIESLQHGGDSVLGSGLALGGALAMVGYLVIGRAQRQSRGVLSYCLPVYLVCAATLCLATVANGTPLVPVPPGDIGLFLALALAPTIGGHTVFNWTLRHLPASAVATAFLGEPVGAALLAWLFLNEQPSDLALLGGLVVLLGVYLAARHA